MIAEQKKIVILKELSEYIIPLTDEEFKLLERNVIAEGCREPLIVWKKDDKHTILIDGHNRHKICQKHKISFKTKTMVFEGLQDVKTWMIDNQMGRRNLTPDQVSYYRGLKYLSLKKTHGGYDNHVNAKGKAENVTSEILAERFNVSESTIKRDAKFAEGLNIIQRSNPKLKNEILSGFAKVRKSDVQMLTNSKKADKLTIKNEADLFNKSKQIHEDILDEVESRLKKSDEERVSKAQATLKELEPAFLNKEDRLKKIKAMIVSAINRAINMKDGDAIKELKRLIDKLQDELFV